MTLFRTSHKKNYTVVNNQILGDSSISWKAKGIWLYAMSRPDDWNFNLEDIINQSTDGRESVRSALLELKNAGYLIKNTQVKDEKGQFTKVEWIFFETPQEIKIISPMTGFPSTGELPTVSHPLLSTEIPSTDKQSKEPIPKGMGKKKPPPPEKIEFAPLVKMTQDEYNKLKQLFLSEELLRSYITRMENYIPNHKNPSYRKTGYPNAFRALLNWWEQDGKPTQITKKQPIQGKSCSINHIDHSQATKAKLWDPATQEHLLAKFDKELMSKKK